MKRKLLLVATALLLGITSCNKKTCVDGKQNQGESGIDCGGPCPACGTCSDGVKNQNETGIDCGGVCSSCPTCSDGIQNQGEGSIDCGGPCAACAISYPDTGFYGRNILRLGPTDTLYIDSVYSMTANIGVGARVRVRLTEVGFGTVSWAIPTVTGPAWHNDGVIHDKIYQDFNAVGQVFADRPITSWIGVTTSRMFIAEYFHNGSATPNHTKGFYWK